MPQVHFSKIAFFPGQLASDLATTSAMKELLSVKPLKSLQKDVDRFEGQLLKVNRYAMLCIYGHDISYSWHSNSCFEDLPQPSTSAPASVLLRRVVIRMVHFLKIRGQWLESQYSHIDTRNKLMAAISSLGFRLM